MIGLVSDLVEVIFKWSNDCFLDMKLELLEDVLVRVVEVRFVVRGWNKGEG